MQINYTNVCSIRNASVDFEPGKLVCIKGETNQGKSAMFYSLVAGLANTPDFKRFINNDALKENAKATEKIDIIDDEKNFWQVEASLNSFHYRTNKAKHEKVGRKSIFEVISGQIPGFLYDPENTTPIMNIIDEDSGMFPIDRSDSQIFKTYERLLSLSKTEDILRAIKLDVEDIDFKSSELLRTSQQAKAQLVNIDTFYKDFDIEMAKKSKSMLLNFKAKLEELESELESTSFLSNYVATMQTVSLSNIEFFDVANFTEKIENYVKATKITEYCSTANYDIKQQEDFNIDKLQSLCKSLATTLEISKELSMLQTNIDNDILKLKGITDILDTIRTCPYCGREMEK